MNYTIFLSNGTILYIAADDFKIEFDLIIFYFQGGKVGACKKSDCIYIVPAHKNEGLV